MARPRASGNPALPFHHSLSLKTRKGVPPCSKFLITSPQYRIGIVWHYLRELWRLRVLVSSDSIRRIRRRPRHVRRRIHKGTVGHLRHSSVRHARHRPRKQFMHLQSVYRESPMAESSSTAAPKLLQRYKPHSIPKMASLFPGRWCNCSPRRFAS